MSLDDPLGVRAIISYARQSFPGREGSARSADRPAHDVVIQHLTRYCEPSFEKAAARWEP